MNPADKVNVADLMAVILAAVMLGGPVFAWARRSSASPPVVTGEIISAAKETLTTLVAEQWRTEATIRSLSDPQPIPITWHLVDDTTLMDHPHLIGEQPLKFTATSNQISALATDFQRLHRRRLVITGGPGTGKTTLSVQLLLELVGGGYDSDGPVPVLAPIAGWDTITYPRLHDWLALRLTQDYPALNAPTFGPKAAKALVDRGHILPILDGLDELPEQHRAAAIGALNATLADRDGFILTSRTVELITAVEEAGDVLTAAAVIAPHPLTPNIAIEYLRDYCLPPRPRHDWAPIWTALTNADAPGLAEITSTALGLWLIRAVYITPCADPAPLLGPLSDQRAALRAHLLDRLITAVIATRPPSTDPAEYFRPRRAWEPVHTRHYLTYLAHLLTTHETRDLAWWQLGSYALSRSQKNRIALRAGFPIGLMAGLILGLSVVFTGGSATRLSTALIAGLIIGLVSAIMVCSSVINGFRDTPAYANLRLRGRTIYLVTNLTAGLGIGIAAGFIMGIMNVITAGFTTGFVAAFATVLVENLIEGLWIGLVLGIGLALAFGFSWWVQQPASAAAAVTPLSSWRADRALTIVRTIGIGVPIGLISGIAGIFTDGFIAGLIIGSTLGLVGGIILGFLGGDHHAWLAFRVTACQLARANFMPRDLMAFLDDAHSLGLLRTIGPIYQFRHADLQDHLAVVYEQEYQKIVDKTSS